MTRAAACDRPLISCEHIKGNHIKATSLFHKADITPVYSINYCNQLAENKTDLPHTAEKRGDTTAHILQKI